MRAFPEEFRRDVVEIARNKRKPRKKIVEDFGISPATLSNWLKADKVENETRYGVTKDQVEKLRQLRRAAAYLSQANLKLGGSPK